MARATDTISNLQHEAMLKSCDLALSRRKPSESGAQSQVAPCLLVFYTHHRPHLADRDMDFFTKAQERGWHCEEILTRKYPVRTSVLRLLTQERLPRLTSQPMFPEDPGEEEVRATVHGWRLTRV